MGSPGHEFKLQALPFSKISPAPLSISSLLENPSAVPSHQEIKDGIDVHSIEARPAIPSPTHSIESVHSENNGQPGGPEKPPFSLTPKDLLSIPAERVRHRNKMEEASLNKLPSILPPLSVSDKTGTGNMRTHFRFE